MIISSTVTNMNGKSKKEIKSYVKEVEARTLIRPCFVCSASHDVIAQMFTFGDRFFFLSVCRDCLKDRMEIVTDFIREYCNQSA